MVFLCVEARAMQNEIIAPFWLLLVFAGGTLDVLSLNLFSDEFLNANHPFKNEQNYVVYIILIKQQNMHIKI